MFFENVKGWCHQLRPMSAVVIFLQTVSLIKLWKIKNGVTIEFQLLRDYTD